MTIPFAVPFVKSLTQSLLPLGQIKGDVSSFGHGIRGLKYHVTLMSLYGLEESITANAVLGDKVRTGPTCAMSARLNPQSSAGPQITTHNTQHTHTTQTNQTGPLPAPSPPSRRPRPRPRRHFPGGFRSPGLHRARDGPSGERRVLAAANPGLPPGIVRGLSIDLNA